MRLGTFFIFLLSFTGMAVPAAAQQTPNRIEVNGEPLWISGSNVAWVDFARDLGPGSARLSEFELAFRTL